MATALKTAKSKKAVPVPVVEKPAMLVLKYYDNTRTLQYSYFTTNERQTAIEIAAAYDGKGYKPRLYYSPYDGEGFKTLYDYESRARKARKAA